MDLLLDQEEKIQCPFNPSHYIMRKRMNTHLSKCKKSYPDSKLVDCDFNVTHKIPEPELQYHHENCPDRRKFEQIVYYEAGTQMNKYPVHNVEVEAEESWDYMDTPSYNPAKYCETNVVVRRKDVASAAVRKNFRLEERHRLHQLSNNVPTPSTDEPQQANGNHSSARRRLPDVPTGTIEEATPASVTALMERINIGKNKPFVPRQNVGQ